MQSNSLEDKVKKDAEQIGNNYGRDLKLVEPKKGGPSFPTLQLNAPNEEHRETILDEIITVIVNEGYDTTYIKLDKAIVAFQPTDCYSSLPDEITTAIDECLSAHNLTPSSGRSNGPTFEAYKLKTGYRVDITFIGSLDYDTFRDIIGENQTIYINNEYSIDFIKIKNGDLSVRVVPT